VRKKRALDWDCTGTGGPGNDFTASPGQFQSHTVDPIHASVHCSGPVPASSHHALTPRSISVPHPQVLKIPLGASLNRLSKDSYEIFVPKIELFDVRTRGSTAELEDRGRSTPRGAGRGVPCVL
jgi:hypothetical protein